MLVCIYVLFLRKVIIFDCFDLKILHFTFIDIPALIQYRFPDG